MLLGPIVAGIEILRHTSEPIGLPQQLPARGFVGGAAKELAVHEAFHRHNRMAISLLPFLGKPSADQPEGAAGQVGPLGPVDQHHKTAVLS